MHPNREKEAPLMDPVSDALRLDFERNGDQFGVWSYHHADFRVTIDHFHESRGHVTAELMFAHFDGSDLFGPVRLDLMAPKSRFDLARALSSRDGEMPWSLLLDQTIALVLREWRRVERASLLDPAALPKNVYHLGPLIPKGTPTVLYGDGETGKSLLTLALALSAATGEAVVPGIVPVGRTPVLYLDWEADRAQHADRLKSLMAGAGLEDRGALHYLAMQRPLADSIPFLRTECDRLKIGHVVCDSFAYACGPEPETADAAMRIFSGLRSLGAVTTIIIAHVPQALRAQDGPTRPYGSVFVRNSARLTWEVRQSQDRQPGLLRLGLFCTKNNLGPRLGPFGYEIRFTESRIEFTACSVREDPDLSTHLPLSTRILTLLAKGPSSYPDLVAATGATLGSVKGTCARLVARGLAERQQGPGGTMIAATPARE
jgi:hypothetical protein